MMSSPFRIQAAAFAAEGSTPAGGAELLFARSLDAFDVFLGEPGSAELLHEHARRVPGSADPDRLVAAVLESLPGWLREFHFERFYDHLAAGRRGHARSFWALVVRAHRLERVGRGGDLETARADLCQRYRVSRDLVRGSDRHARFGALWRAEAILDADPRNRLARRLCLEGYTSEIEQMRDDLRAHGGGPRPRAGSGVEADVDLAPLRRLAAGERIRLRRRLRRSVRRVRRHLNVLRREGGAEARDLLRAYQLLALHYLEVGERESSSRMLRRARRHAAGDTGFREWARRIRRARRRT